MEDDGLTDRGFSGCFSENSRTHGRVQRARNQRSGGLSHVEQTLFWKCCCGRKDSQKQRSCRARL
jgi:hypothetical protein